MKKISEANGVRVYVGKITDNDDEFNMLYSADITASKRVDAMCEVARQHFEMKGIDLDARRLDRSVQIIEKAWRQVSHNRR